MLDRRTFVWATIIALLFIVSLMGFYAFSSDLGDGLEVTMEKAGVAEGKQLMDVPLDYGESYSSTLFMGSIGIAVSLLIATMIFFGLSRKAPRRK